MHRSRPGTMRVYREAPPKISNPDRCEVTFDELPAPSRERVLGMAAAVDDPRRLVRGTRFLAILVASAGVLVLLGVAVSILVSTVDGKTSFDRRTPWDASEIQMATAACFLGGLLLALLSQGRSSKGESGAGMPQNLAGFS